MLEWNVYTSDFNQRRIVVHNIFNHYRFWEDCIKNKKKNKNNKEEFVKQLRTDLQYFYWSKSEWEIILQQWPPSDNFNDEKIDVFDQVYLNWDKFVDYVWNNLKEIKKEKE